MDFHHVLPSNTSPDYFPNNSASEYSTPLDNPHVLSGEWEVGLMNLTYPTCVNTFNNDKIIVTENCALVKDCAPNVKNPLKVMLTVPTSKDPYEARKELVQDINEKFQSLLELKLTEKGKWCYWKLLTKDYYFILGQEIKRFFQIWSDVVTTMDRSDTNMVGFYIKDIPTEQSELFIILVNKDPSFHVKHVTFTLKSKTEEKMTSEMLLARFQSRIEPNVIQMTMGNDQFFLKKLYDDNTLIILNEHLRSALTFTRAGMYRAGNLQHLGVSFHDLKSEWTFTLIALKDIKIHQAGKTRTITLSPCSFEEENEAIHFVNSKVSDQRITFTCDTRKCITLNIREPQLSVTFDDTLRDIFAFDKNTYSGEHAHIASDIFSLNRRIQFLYIYSNVSEYIRIGNTESPLLAIVPFSNADKCSLFKEKTFKTPMYIRACRNRLSQIDIAIYDGAGQLVPFVPNAVTTTRLHFRQI